MPNELVPTWSTVLAIMELASAPDATPAYLGSAGNADVGPIDLLPPFPPLAGDYVFIAVFALGTNVTPTVTGPALTVIDGGTANNSGSDRLSTWGRLCDGSEGGGWHFDAGGGVGPYAGVVCQFRAMSSLSAPNESWGAANPVSVTIPGSFPDGAVQHIAIASNGGGALTPVQVWNDDVQASSGDAYLEVFVSTDPASLATVLPAWAMANDIHNWVALSIVIAPP